MKKLICILSIICLALAVCGMSLVYKLLSKRQTCL